jgi:type I restriction enzyme S subunit
MIKSLMKKPEWADAFSENIQFIPLGNLVRLRNEKNDPIKLTQVLSLTADRGVIPYEEKGAIGNNASEDISRYSVVRKGDIVLNSMNVVIGSVGLSKYEGVLSPVYYVLTPVQNNLIDMRFLAYHFQIHSFQKSLIRLGYGILDHRMRIPWVNLKAEKIAVPPIEEQRRIVELLDEQTLRIEKLLTLKNLQFEGYLSIHDSRKNEIVWNNENAELTPLRYLVKCNKNSLGSNTPPDFKFRYCDVGSVNFRTGISEELDNFTFSDAPSRARRIAKKGDVIFSMVRPYLRAVATVPQLDFQYIFSTAFAVLEPLKIETEYLFELLTTTRFLSETEKWSSGMGYPAINQDDLLKIKVPFLDTRSQSERISRLTEERLNSNLLIKTIEDSIKTLSEYKNSLITAAVLGTRDDFAGRTVA